MSLTLSIEAAEAAQSGRDLKDTLTYHLKAYPNPALVAKCSLSYPTKWIDVNPVTLRMRDPAVVATRAPEQRGKGDSTYHDLIPLQSSILQAPSWNEDLVPRGFPLVAARKSGLCASGLPEGVSSPPHIYHIRRTSTAEVDCAQPNRTAKRRTFDSSTIAIAYQPTAKSQIRKQMEHEVENEQTEARGQNCEKRVARRWFLTAVHSKRPLEKKAKSCRRRRLYLGRTNASSDAWRLTWKTPIRMVPSERPSSIA